MCGVILQVHLFVERGGWRGSGTVPERERGRWRDRNGNISGARKIPNILPPRVREAKYGALGEHPTRVCGWEEREVCGCVAFDAVDVAGTTCVSRVSSRDEIRYA